MEMIRSDRKSKSSNGLEESGFGDFYVPLPGSRRSIPNTVSAEKIDTGDNSVINKDLQHTKNGQEESQIFSQDEEYNYSNIPPFSRMNLSQS